MSDDDDTEYDPTKDPESDEFGWEWSESAKETLAELEEQHEQTQDSAQDEWDGPRTRSTNTNGAANFGEIPIGKEYSIDVEHPEYESNSYTPTYLRDTESRGIRLTREGRRPIIHLDSIAGPRTDVRIRLSNPDGARIRDATVRIGSVTRTTNHLGVGRFDLLAERHTVSMSAEGYHDRTETINVAESESTVTIDFVLQPSVATPGSYLYRLDRAPMRAFAAGYWPLDDESGATNLQEAVGGHSAERTNGSLGHPGVYPSISTAFDCGSTSQPHRITVPNARDVADSMGTWTLCCWVYLRSSGTVRAPISFEETGANGEEYAAYTFGTGGRPRVLTGGRGSSPVGDRIAGTNQWHHVALRWDGREFVAYLNGSRTAAFAPNVWHDWIPSLNRITWGTRMHASSGEVDGLLDELIYFDAPLSSSQVSALHRAGQTGSLPGGVSGQSGAGVTLEVDADIPAGASVRIRLTETPTGSGSGSGEPITGTFTASDGRSQTVFSDMRGASDADMRYHPRVEVENEYRGTTPRVRSVTIRVASGQAYDLLSASINGNDIIIPTYDPDAIPTINGYHMMARRGSSDSPGALSLKDTRNGPLQARHPTTDRVYDVEFLDADEEPPTTPPGGGGNGGGDPEPDPDPGPDPEPEPEPPVDLSEDARFSVSSTRHGIQFSELADYQSVTGTTAEPEGIAYRESNGRLYTGERAPPATLREWRTNGTLTGERMEIPGGAINMLKWHDGELWVSSGTERKTYIIDWAAKSIVDTIDYAAPVANSSWREIVPDSTGDLKLIFPQFRGSRVYVIDAGDARADGTTAGNVDRDLPSGYWYNPQTMLWDPSPDERTVYTTTHEHVIKHELPYIDHLPDSYPIYSNGVEWFNPLPGSRTLEQLTGNAARDEFYLLDRAGSGTILSGSETSSPQAFSNGDFGRWPTTTVGGNVESHALRVNSEGTERLYFNLDPSVGTVETRLFDDGAADKRVYPAAIDMNNAATNLGVATHQSWGGEKYGFWDGEWSDTGVDRVSGEWVRFRWTANGSVIRAHINASTTSGWQLAGTSSRSAATIRGIRIQHATGEAFVGPWDVDLERE